MRRSIVLLTLILALTTSAFADEVVWEYSITDFPKGVGSSVDTSFWKPHGFFLNMVNLMVTNDSTLMVEIEAYVDANQFEKNQDANNGGLLTNRYTATKNQLTANYEIPKDRILPPDFDETKRKTGDDRKVVIRVKRMPTYVTAQQLQRSLDSLTKANEETSVKNETHLHSTTYFSFSFLELGAGVSTHWYGTAIPFVRGRTGSDIFSVEAVFGHSLHKNGITAFGEDLDAMYRLVGGYLVYTPSDSSRYSKLSFLAGWERAEERSTKYGRYARKLEGPVVGVRYQISRQVALSGYWTPNEEDDVDHGVVDWKLDTFRISLDIKKIWR